MRSKLREAFDSVKIKRKIKSRSGFSLAETLVAIIILLLVSAIVAEGIPVAKNAYEKVVYAANAKVMLSTAITTLRNELAMAQRIEVDSTKKSVTYYSADRGATSRIYLSDGTDGCAAKTIMLQEYGDYNSTFTAEGETGVFDILGLNKEVAATSSKARAMATSLETQRGQADKLYVTYDDIVYTPVDPTDITTPLEKRLYKITITGLKVCRVSDAEGSEPLAKFGTNSSDNKMDIRVIPNRADYAVAAQKTET